MWRKLSKRLFKEDGWHEVVWTTAIISLFQFTIGFTSFTGIQALLIEIGLDVLQGLSIGLFLFLVVNVIEIRFESYFDKRQKYELKISTDTELNNIINLQLIHDYFKKVIVNILDDCHSIQEKKNLIVAPHIIYGHIIHSSKWFNKSVVSVDLDLNAWHYACEIKDFDKVSVFYKDKRKPEENKQALSLLRSKFTDECAARRRIDLTCNISCNMQDRIAKTDNLGKRGTVKRLIVLQKEVSQLTEKELVILAFFMRITKDTSQKIWNKYLVKSEYAPDSDEISALDDLQDIVLFDSQIAYKEYLNDNNVTGESTIITNDDEIESCIKKFDELFTLGSEISEIFK